MYQPHLEFMTTEQRESKLAACSWEVTFTDWDGTLASAECPAQPDVYLVYEDRWGAFDGEDGEVLGVEFCRPHGNLALIEERKEGGE